MPDTLSDTLPPVDEGGGADVPEETILEGGGGEGMEGGGEGEGHPSLADILDQGYPGEWTWFVGIGVVVTLIMSGLFIRAFMAHKKYSTKHTLQVTNQSQRVI